MYGEKACTLIKELSRNEGVLPPYNSEVVNEVVTEMGYLATRYKDYFDEKKDDRNESFQTFKVEHAALERNQRCLEAYYYNRLKSIRNLRWDFGSILPPDIRSNLSTSEFEWFNKYSHLLGTYMKSIGDEGLNLGLNLKPPKDLYIEVRCLSDYGRCELSDGTIILLKKDTRHHLPRAECEDLIRQGVLQHIL